MKIDLLDIEKLIQVNNLQEVTKYDLWANNNKGIFHPEGILSDRIFGISKKDRRGTFAYIDLKNYYIHPHIYENVLKRMCKDVVKIVSGQERFTVVDGKLTRSENGWTGLQSLYENWNKIDWNKLNSTNERSLKLLSQIKRNEAFITKFPIIPPAYRDIMIAGTIDTSDYVNELSDFYQQLIRAIALLQEGGMLLRNQFSTQVKVQNILGGIFDYCKSQIAQKYGLIRRHLIGKHVDFGTRAVISAFSYNNETVQENMVGIEHTALPIAQCCSTFYPFIQAWVKNFFTIEIINNPELIDIHDLKSNKKLIAKLKDPEIQFSDKIIKKMIDDYVFNPDNRFKPITIKAIISNDNEEDKDIQGYMVLKGKKILSNNTEDILNRVMTVTDVLYLACVDVCEKRHVMITRYPVGTDKGLFFNKVRVQSTKTHIHIVFNGKDYPYYPNIDFNVPSDQVGVQFIDTCVFSNSLLDGLGGD